MLPLVEQYWRFEGITGFDAARLAEPLSELLSHPALGAGWLAFSDGNPAGYLLVAHLFSLEHGGLTAEIDELFVVPAQRRRQLGGALLTAAEAGCRAAGCVGVALQIGRGNDAARSFYLRHGYAKREGYELLEKSLSR